MILFGCWLRNFLTELLLNAWPGCCLGVVITGGLGALCWLLLYVWPAG